MTEITATTAAYAPPQPGLPARIVGVIFSPRDTYTTVAVRPRAFGVLALVTVLMAGAQFAFLSTDLGQELALDQQIRAMEAFGRTVSDEMYAQLEGRMQVARYISLVSVLIGVPLLTAIVAGLLMVVFTMILGGAATFNHVYAMVAHAGIIFALQQLFGLPLTYATGEMSGANVGVFAPMLDDRNFAYLFLSSVDLFVIWWCISLAIGVGVLYRRRTGPIATGLISLSLLIAVAIALVRS